MAHTKAKGSTQLGRDSESKRLGIKKTGGQLAQAGDIIVRQRGTKFVSGKNTGIGKDDTIFAKTSGQVVYNQKNLPSFTGKNKKRTIVSVN